MKIVVGYDGSNAAKDALRLARTHGRAFDNASVFVLRSISGRSSEDAEDIKEAEGDLAYAQKLFEEAGIPCETHLLVRGLSPAEDIIQFAEDNKADEIIVGVRRRSRVGKALFGSTSRHVIMEAPCPVVTIR